MIKKKVIGAILCGAMVLSGCYGSLPNTTVSAKSEAQVKKEKEETEAKKKEAQSKLKELETAKDDVLEIIQDLDNQIADYQTKIDSLNAQKNQLNTKVSITQNKLQNAYIAEKNQYANMKKRIQYAYENGDKSYLDALMSVKDMSSMNNQSEYVNSVSEYDRKQIEKLAEIEKEIATYKSDLAKQLEEVEEVKSKAESEQAGLKVIQDGKKDTLKKYNLDIDSTNADIEKLAEIEAQQDAELASIIAQAEADRKRQQEAAAAARNTSAQTASSGDASSSSSSSSSGNTATAGSYDTTPQYSGGAFAWPCPGHYSIVSEFGPRTAPTAGASSYHKGIDIDCPMYTPVTSAAPGTVYYTGWVSGGGNCVIVSHGNGLYTLYMHLSSYAVSPGTSVNAGTVIAYSGNTGISTGPHLHFSVSSGSAFNYVNPHNYL